MATQNSRKAQFFYSWRRQDTEALALDALIPDVDWTGWECQYVFPPFSLLPAVLQKIKEQKVQEVLMIAPWWPNKPWFPMWMDMVVKVKRLPPYKNLVLDMTTESFPPNILGTRLAVFSVSGNLQNYNTDLSNSPQMQGSWWRRVGGGQLNCPMGDVTLLMPQP